MSHINSNEEKSFINNFISNLLNLIIDRENFEDCEDLQDENNSDNTNFVNNPNKLEKIKENNKRSEKYRYRICGITR